MSNQGKKYNSILLAISLVASFLAIYFGIKSQNLSKKLSEQIITIKEENAIQKNRNIATIDSLLFKEAYTDAYKLSKELRQTENFVNDSTLLLRYNLVSEIVSVKNTANNKNANSYNTYVPKYAQSANENSNTILDSVAQKAAIKNQNLTTTEKNIAAVSNVKNTSEYLTFKTTKGTGLHYIGSIKEEKANGYGVALLETGSRYEGQWVDGKRHGVGKFIWDDGDYYEGNYINDKRSGKGTYYWKNGEKYIGEWSDDKRNGHGEFYNKKGKLKTSGTWKNDELVDQEKKH